jgi:dTDP-D-glucose 4,6-dehydratase
MKVLVTGGAGYIGSVVTERLLAEGHETTVLDDLSEGHRDAIPAAASFVEVDLRDRAALRGALAGRSFEAVMHLAASCLVGEPMENPGKYFENNLSAGVNLLEETMPLGVDRGDLRRSRDDPHHRGLSDRTDELVRSVEAPLRECPRLVLAAEGTQVDRTALFQRSRRGLRGTRRGP